MAPVEFIIRCVLPVLLLSACTGCAWRSAVYRGIDGHPRDPDTGIMHGAEPVEIDRGRSRAVLLLHGWLGNPGEFGRLPEALDEAGWDVYAPLHPGHGTRPVDLEGVTAEQIVAAARERFRSLQERYERVAVLGFSMGGAVAAVLAAEHPPDRLALVAPFFGVTYRWYYLLPARAWNALLSPLVPCVESPVKLAAVNRPGAEEDFITYRAFPRDATRVLRDLRLMVWNDGPAGPVPTQITCPTLIVYAPGDIASSPERIAEFRKALATRDRTAVDCNRSNHHILHDYDSDRAIRAIEEFLGE